MKTPARMERKLLRRGNTRYWAVLLSVLVISGCAFKFVYNQLDWVLPWYVKSFVSLSDEQSRFLKAKISGHLDWHRKTQLTLYADWLKRWQVYVAEGIDRAELEQTNGIMQSLAQDLIEQLLPDITHMLSIAEKTQVEKIVLKLEQDNEEFEQELTELSTEQYRVQQIENTEQYLEYWLGDIEPHQQAEIQQWSRNFIPVTEKTIYYREIWLRQFKAAMMDSSRDEKFSEKMHKLIVSPEQDWDAEYRKILDKNGDITNTMWLNVINNMSAQQKKHAHKKISGWIEQLEDLM